MKSIYSNINTMRTNELTLLRFFAIFLITNSHLDSFYPISQLGTGGSLGNSIFFLISAIGLTLSLNKKKISFFKWYKKRIFRIYPIVWILLSINLFFFIPDNFHIYDWIIYYLAIYNYWFIPVLAAFYIPLFFIYKYSENKLKYIGMFVVVIYFAYYIFWIDKSSWSIEELGGIKNIFYFLVFMQGIIIAKR